MKKFWFYFWGSALIALILLSVYFTRLPNGQLHAYFLDIGQGDSILIQTPAQQQILIDGGPGNKVLEELGAVLPFFNREIDLMILTHPDRDHLSGLLFVLERYQVKKVLLTGIFSEDTFYQEFLKKIKEQKIPFEIVQSERDFDLGEGIFLDVLWPLESIAGQKWESSNDSSIVFKLIYGENEVLFTGDAEKEVEEKLLENGFDFKADVLKVSHHGSKNSGTAGFLEAVKAEEAVIQVGKDNQFGHPAPSTLARLQKAGLKIFRTDLDGRIEIVF